MTKKKRFLWFILVTVLLLAPSRHGLAYAQTPVPASSPSGTEEATASTDSDSAEPTADDSSDSLLLTRAPEPTATPGPIEEVVDDITAAAGLTQTTFLGLAAADWISLVISLLLVLIGYLLGAWLTGRLLLQIARRTPTTLDDAPVEAISPGLRWLILVLLLNFATSRLTFLGAGLRTFLKDVYFVAGLAITVLILWRLIDLTDQWYRERLAVEGREDDFEPIIALSVRVGRVLVALVAISVLLSHFGINISALVAALGIGGLALSLAAKDTIADAISGFIILVDRPFRIGDRIEIQEVGTWGDVTEIGIRTTSIRTRDNRMVIIPNSVIGTNQVINYTYPDPQYRIETHVGVAYGTDIETARRVMIEAVRQVEGVLPDRPVEALYIEMGGSAMIFRVRWWLESYADTRRMFDQVHTALQHALDAAGIDSPYPTQSLHLHVEPESVNLLSQAMQKLSRPAPAS